LTTASPRLQAFAAARASRLVPSPDGPAPQEQFAMSMPSSKACWMATEPEKSSPLATGVVARTL
jgi:hypothetical protein